MAHRIRIGVLAIAIASLGCHSYIAMISVQREAGGPAFTQREQDEAKAIAVEISRAAGFWETDVAQKLSADESSWPYVVFVSLGAPGGTIEQRSTSILGSMRKDRREIEISVRDYERGEPLPATRKLIDDLRAALERTFSDCLVQVTGGKKVRWFAP